MSVSASPTVATGAPLEVLKRFLGGTAATRPGPQCELCRTAIDDTHAHVVNLQTRALLCACRACYLLFTHAGAADGKCRAVPERYHALPAFELTPVQWDRLQIPVGIAFFFFNSVLARVSAFYPSPAGATESLLPLDAWQDIADANPLLRTLEPDVEALLLYRRRDRPFESFLVPIDACYELTGHVRRHWKGFDGGADAWREIDAFFARLRARSRPAGATP